MRAVVSFANTPFYLEKMKRLQDSVEAQGIKFIGYKSFEEVGCKPHSEVPYQFKPYSIFKAIGEGVTSVLWLDSPVVAVGDLSPVFQHIETYGYLFFNNYGHPLGKWSHDKALNYFKMTREEAMNVSQVMACAMGFWAKDWRSEAFLGQYYDLSDDLYPGSWENSRHDQMVASFIIKQMGMTILDGHKTFFIYEHFKQVPEFQPIADSVCLISR